MLEKLLFGLRTLGIGMLTILSMIAIVFLLLKFVFPLLYKLSNKKNKKSKEEIVPPVQTTVEEVTNDEEDEEEIIAVLTAAIAASTQKPVSSFRVVNFKRI